VIWPACGADFRPGQGGKGGGNAWAERYGNDALGGLLQASITEQAHRLLR
jgi:hypothetical protein